MQVGLLSVLLSLCLVYAVGRGVLMELDIETIPAMALLEADPVKGDKTDFTNCTKAGDEASINSVDITPAVLQKGENISVTMNITFKEDVNGGTIHLNVTLHGIKLFDHTFVLCDVIEDSETPCPITKGTRIIKLVKEIPSYAPPAEYKGFIIVKDQNGNELACFHFDATIH